MVVGILGCIVPFLPGPPISYAGLILLQLTSKHPFSSEFLVIWAVVTGAIVLLDYYIPIYGTKKFGGTKSGTWGATFGMIIGMFAFPPIGLIVGPFVGAFLGELLANQKTDKALKSAFGSFVGFLVGIVMKLGVSIVMTFYFVRSLF